MKKLLPYFFLLLFFIPFYPTTGSGEMKLLPTVTELEQWTRKYLDSWSLTYDPSSGEPDRGFQIGKRFIYIAPQDHPIKAIVVLITQGSNGVTYTFTQGCLFKGEKRYVPCGQELKEWSSETSSELYAGY